MRKKPLQQRSRQMVESIIDATAKVVAEEGLGALTTNRVAEVAGISNGSLYQYFHDREDLLDALIARVSDDVMRMFNVRLPPAQVEGENARQIVRFGMKIVLDFMRANPLYLELVRNWSQIPFQVFLDPLERFWLQRTQQYLARNAAGRVAPDLHARFYIQFNSVAFNMVRYASDPPPHLEEDELLDALAENVAMTIMPAMQVPGAAGS